MANPVLEISDRVKARGVPVFAVEGCEARGNGSSWGIIEGHVNHHTGGGNNIYYDKNLVSGVPGLSGPLCNWCITYDGDIGIIAAYPANHAGASGGWDTAPLPVTRDFNRRVLGTEIQYKGTEPMSPAQYRTMCILNHEIHAYFGWVLDYARSKTHNGTSIQGKWDPGYAPGKTYDIAALRRDFGTIGGNGKPLPPPDPDAWPLASNEYWGPLDGPAESISNSFGTERSYSIAGLKRWQQLMGIPDTGIYDVATADAATKMQIAKGWPVTGYVWPGEWQAVVKEGWRPSGAIVVAGADWSSVYRSIAGDA